MKVFTFFVSFLTLSSCFREGSKNSSDGNTTESFSGRNVIGISANEKGSYCDITIELQIQSLSSKDKLFNLRRNLFDVETFSRLIESSNLSQECQRDYKDYLNALVNFELWALESEFLGQTSVKIR